MNKTEVKKKQKTSDAIDHTVGLALHAKLGTAVKRGNPLATVYYSQEKLRAAGISVEALTAKIATAFSVAAQKPKAQSLVKKVVE